MTSESAAMVEPHSGWVAGLHRFVRGASTAEHCELCSEALASRHAHLLDLQRRTLACACPACALLFSAQQGSAYRLIPDISEPLPALAITDAQWEALRIPIGIAFFYRSTPQRGQMVAMYPGPAGATESLLPLDAWDEIAQHNATLAQMAPDVEALLVYRVDGSRDHYRVSIDRCYALVGLIRTHWRGLSGGAEAWQEIHRFFAQLAEDDAPPESLHA